MFGADRSNLVDELSLQWVFTAPKIRRWQESGPANKSSIFVFFRRSLPRILDGLALAEYQWFSTRTFKDIFARIPASKIVQMYSVYHKMDISQFLDAMGDICSSTSHDAKLKKLREIRGLSQSELAQASGVSLRSIQVYEQRENNIDKAQAHTLYKLAHVLICTIEELLENPMK